MVQPLPTEKLDWVNPKDFSLDNYSKELSNRLFLRN